MKSWINTSMMTLFFISLAIYLVWFAIHRPRVFVLQSYATDYSWTRDLDKAIRELLSKEFYNIRYHYMDTKKHSDSEFKQIAGNLARQQINEWQPDILIAVDDNAQSLVSICYIDPAKMDINQVLVAQTDPNARMILGQCHEVHPNLNIIFAGIGAKPQDYGFDGQNHVTGITERMDVLAIKEALLIISESMKKNDLRIVAPIDDSTSGIYNLASLIKLKRMMEPSRIWITPQVIKTFSEWQAMVAHTNEEADLLLFSNYHTIKCGTTSKSPRIAPDALIEWTEANSQIPGIGAWGFYVMDGGMLAVGVSPFEQGRVAAQMAIEIINNKADPTHLEIQTTHQSIIFMREALMRYYQLELPRIYEAFARATGNFYECTDQIGNCKADLQQIAIKKQNHLINKNICMPNSG